MKSIDKRTGELEKNALTIIKESLTERRFRYIGINQVHLPKEDVYRLDLKIHGITSSLIVRNENRSQELPIPFSLDCLEYFCEIK